ncbi:MAG: phosphohydrolase [Anaerolineae bacterium]|nr:phosphohydrolase [Anaerolineae bacterium]
MLERLGAPDHLLQHVSLVGEALEELLAGLSELGISPDVETVCIGVVLHHAGKILYPNELVGPGSEHEAAGEALLLRHGVAPHLARICRSHAQWRDMDVSLEELLVGLADRLWKGKRATDLEERVVDVLSRKLGRDRWELYIQADDLFERVASRGVERLARSMSVGGSAS